MEPSDKLFESFELARHRHEAAQEHDVARALARTEEVLRQGAIKLTIARASRIASLHVKPGEKRPTQGEGWRVDSHSPWIPVQVMDDSKVLEMRMSTKTELIDLGNGRLLRTWGVFFDGYQAVNWLDARIVSSEDARIVSDIDRAVVVFSEDGKISDKTPIILSRLDSVTMQPVGPDTPEFAELDEILTKFEALERVL